VAEFRVDRLLEALTSRGIDFVVVGGIAATLLGSARDTFDLDICPAPDPPNLDALGKLLVELHARLRGIEDTVPFVPDSRALAQVQVLTLDTDLGPLDVLMQPSGAPAYEQLRRSAEQKDLGAFSVRVASIEDLIAMKEAAGRPKDLIVVEELEAVRRLRRRLDIAE
jgi:predicted nucleotidyltransferase